MAPSMISRFQGALLGCFAGDALGRPFEGAAVTDPRLARDLAKRVEAEGAWLYTDDTEMMIGVAESVARCGRVEPDDVLRSLAAGYDPARGYGKGMKLAFAALANGAAPDRVAFAGWAEGSKGNGAAVRIAPVACLLHESPDELEAHADAVARTTHAHPVGRAGCVLQALGVAAALRVDAATFDRERFLGELGARIAKRDAGLARKLATAARLVGPPPAPREVVAALGNGVAADESVPLALFAFAAWFPSFERVVTGAIACGGDTDTIGAMSGALAGAAGGVEGIPERWVARLENRERGRDHVVKLAEAIHGLWRARGA